MASNDRKQIDSLELQIRQQEESFTAIVNAIRDYAIFLLDPSGIILTWNEGARRIKGYEATEIIGKHFSIFYTEFDRKRNHPAFELEVAKREGVYEEEGWRIHKNGATFWTSVNIAAILDDDQKLRGFVKVTRDLSERKKADEALRRSEEIFRLMVSAVKDYAIFLLDPEGRVQTWNEGAQRIKGYAAEEIIGKHFSQFYTDVDKAKNHPEFELQEARKEGHYEEEGWRICKDGSLIWAQVTITPVSDEHGSLRGFVKVTRDLTGRRKTEDEISRARDEAIRANELKSQFIANVSHEIRTPMAGVIGMSEQLVTDDTLNEDQREAAEHVFLSSTRLLEVLNDLLDFSKLEAGRVSLDETTFSLKNMMTEVGNSVSAAARKKGLTINVSTDPSIAEEIFADESKVRQALMNLAHNAVKFTRQGQVDISATLVDPDKIRFAVRDTGIGIREEVQENLFEPFVQADGTTRRRFGGTGLGLSITKRFIELMGGQVGFETKEGAGSTFWFVIPLKTA